jgi:ABC-2 type transport system permease protein
VRSTGWGLGAAAGLTLLMTFLVCAGSSTQGSGGGGDMVFMSVSGTMLGQIAVVALAVVVITSEYATGTIRATFAAEPRRRSVLAAKAAVLGAVVLAVGLVTSLASFFMGRAILPGNGYTAVNGYPAPSLADGATLRAVTGTAAYLTLIALLSLGIGAIARHTAIAITSVLGLLFVPTIAADMLPEGTRHTVEKIAPMLAGHPVQTTTESGFGIGPGAGMAVVAAWAVAALAVALWLIERRDA